LSGPAAPELRDKNLVDRDEDQLDEEADKAHDRKAHRGGGGNLGQLLGVGLGAPVDQVHGPLGKVLGRFRDKVELVHFKLKGSNTTQGGAVGIML